MPNSNPSATPLPCQRHETHCHQGNRVIERQLIRNPQLVNRQSAQDTIGPPRVLRPNSGKITIKKKKNTLYVYNCETF